MQCRGVFRRPNVEANPVRIEKSEVGRPWCFALVLESPSRTGILQQFLARSSFLCSTLCFVLCAAFYQRQSLIDRSKKISKNVGATAHYDNVVVLASSLDALHFDQIERYFTAPVPLDQSTG